MKTKNLVILGASVLGVGAAAAGLYAATHPKGAVARDGGGRRRRPLTDDLFEPPADVTHIRIPTPDGGSIHALERGEGRPLVLLHGVTLRSDVWSPQLHQLADRYRVIAVDLRGHGESTAGTAGFGMARLGDDIATLLESLDLREAVVVGHSMGGMSVMRFSGDHPDVLTERVAGLVFLATRSHQVLPPYLEQAGRRLVARGVARVDAGRDLPGRTVLDARAVRLAFGDRPSALATRLVAEMGQSMEPAALMGSVGGLLDHDAREALRGTDIPSLVVVGTRDMLTPVPASSHLAHLLPDSELVVLPRAGHQLMQERPDEIAELIDGFVARIEGDVETVAAAAAADPRPVEAGQVIDPGDPDDGPAPS